MKAWKYICGTALACSMAAGVQAQTVAYDNTTILVDGNGAPFVPNTETPLQSGPNGECCVRKAYLEDVTLAAGGAIKEISFSVFNSARLLGDPFGCFGVDQAEMDIEVYADTGAFGPDDDQDGFVDLGGNTLVSKTLPFDSATSVHVPCGDFAADTVIITVDVSDQNAVVEAGQTVWVRVSMYKDYFRQVQAGPVAVGSTQNGYWEADPSVSPADSGMIRTSDPDANLYLKMTVGEPIDPEPCPCDINGVDDVNFFDLLDFLDLWFAGDRAADFNGDLTTDFFDLLDFLDCWFAASAGDCPLPPPPPPAE